MLLSVVLGVWDDDDEHKDDDGDGCRVSISLKHFTVITSLLSCTKSDDTATVT